MTPDIDITQDDRIMLVCGTCGNERSLPRNWRDLMRSTAEPGWDGILRCRDRHPPAPMHAFDRMEHEQQWRGCCACGHAEVWTADKDAAWQEIASHLLGPLRVALLARRAKKGEQP